MHIIKIGDSYVSATGGLTTRQSDALHVNIPAGPVTPRLVKFRPRQRPTAPDASPFPLRYGYDGYDDSF